MISRSLLLFEAPKRENRSRNKERTCLKSHNVINESSELQRIYKAYYIQVGLYLGNRFGEGEFLVGMDYLHHTGTILRGAYRGRGYTPIDYAYLMGGSGLDASESEQELRQNTCSFIDDNGLVSIPCSLNY